MLKLLAFVLPLGLDPFAVAAAIQLDPLRIIDWLATNGFSMRPLMECRNDDACS